jgi:hypothetical protein
MNSSLHLNRLQAGVAAVATNQVSANQSLFPDANAPAKPIVARHAELLPAPVEPYSSIIELDCDVCGGDGRNHDCHDDHEPCEHCVDGKLVVLRNWLTEAFQISEGHLDTDLRIEHLRALRHYTTQVLHAYLAPLAREVA